MPGLCWTCDETVARVGNGAITLKKAQTMYLFSVLQRASQRTLKRDDQVTGAGRCHIGRRKGVSIAPNAGSLAA